jgi:hypothetical protein
MKPQYTGEAISLYPWSSLLSSSGACRLFWHPTQEHISPGSLKKIHNPQKDGDSKIFSKLCNFSIGKTDLSHFLPTAYGVSLY